MELFYNFIFHPRRAVNQGKEDGNVLTSFFLLVFSILSLEISNSLIFSAQSGLREILFSTIFLLLFTLFTIILSSIVINFSAEIFGKRKTATKLIKLMILSTIPLVFLTPTAIILTAIGGNKIYLLVKMIITIWTVSLQIYILREYYDTSLIKALLMYISPVAAGFFLIALIGILFTFFIFTQLGFNFFI